MAEPNLQEAPTAVRSRRSGDVVATLERVAELSGVPKSIRVDQGPGFISKDLDLWVNINGLTLDFSKPGKPTDNAFIESFSGKFRAECLNVSWFLSLEDALCKRYYMAASLPLTLSELQYSDGKLRSKS